MLKKDYFVFPFGDSMHITANEELLPPNKLAARVPLTSSEIFRLKNLRWTEYQSMLEFYYDHGQKLVTA